MKKITFDDGQTIELADGDYDTALKCVMKHVKTVNSYWDVAKRLFLGKPGFCVGDNAEINERSSFNDVEIMYPLNSVTREQLEAMVIMNIWHNVANVLNNGWVFQGNEPEDGSYHGIVVERNESGKYKIRVIRIFSTFYGAPVFRDQQSAMESVRIIGEEKILKALMWGVNNGVLG